jgi:signal transduction histidine kinase
VRITAADLQFLKSIPILSQLNEQELQELASIIESEVFEVGEQIIVQGKKSQYIFILKNGEASVAINGVQVIKGLQRGEMLGEVSFFTRSQYWSTATVTKRSEVLAIEYERLSKLIGCNPILGLKLYHCFTLEVLQKLQYAHSHAYELVQGDPTKQIAHDIRSPLAALKMLSVGLSGATPQDKELLNLVIGRVDRIADTLLEKSVDVGPSSIEDISLEEVIQCIERILTEKRVQYSKHQKIAFRFSNLSKSRQALSLKVRSNRLQFERVLSNLLDNSFQAISKVGSVEVILKCSTTSVKLSIQDNGKGIPSEVLEEIGKSKVTFDKKNGNGLGLFHAYQQVQAWGGTIRVTSEKKKGTSVQIILSSHK